MKLRGTKNFRCIVLAILGILLFGLAWFVSKSHQTNISAGKMVRTTIGKALQAINRARRDASVPETVTLLVHRKKAAKGDKEAQQIIDSL